MPLTWTVCVGVDDAAVRNGLHRISEPAAQVAALKALPLYRWHFQACQNFVHERSRDVGFASWAGCVELC